MAGGVGEFIGHLTVTCVREPEGDGLHPTTDDPRRVECNAVSPTAGVPGQDEANEGIRLACIIEGVVVSMSWLQGGGQGVEAWSPIGEGNTQQLPCCTLLPVETANNVHVLSGKVYQDSGGRQSSLWHLQCVPE